MFILPAVGLGLRGVSKGMCVRVGTAAAGWHLRGALANRSASKLRRQKEEEAKLAEAKLNHKASALEALEHELCNHQARARALSRQAEDLILENVGLQASLREAEERTQQTTSQLEASQAAAAEAQAECAALQDQINALQSEVERLNTSAAVSSATIEILGHKYRDLETRNHLMLKKFHADYWAVIKDMEREKGARKAAEAKAMNLLAERQARKDRLLAMLNRLPASFAEHLEARRASTDTCSSEQGSSQSGSDVDTEGRDSSTNAAAAPLPAADSTISEDVCADCRCGQRDCRTCAERAAIPAALEQAEDALDSVMTSTPNIFGDSEGEEEAIAQRRLNSTDRVVRLNQFLDGHAEQPTIACLAPLFNGGGSTGVTVEAVMEAHSKLKLATAKFFTLTKRSSRMFVGVVRKIASKSTGDAEATQEKAAAVGWLLSGASGSVSEWWNSEALVAMGAVWAVGGPLMPPSDMQVVLQSIVALRERFVESQAQQRVVLFDALHRLGEKLLG